MRRVLGLFVLFSILAGACAPAAGWLKTRRVSQAERAWLAQNIQDYRITVETVSLWHYQTHELTVRDSDVTEVSASCQPAPAEMGECEVKPFEPGAYTVEGLFDYSMTLVSGEWAQYVQLEFDPQYHYPQRINYDHPEIVDEENLWRVTDFEVLQ